ncbi:MAG TPA: hypothetical protein VNG93_14190 [Candidatus Dormibacteraeota bacterium]|nr:hypothetical protein [Candidatus Dormibacteraeota bacterium]
MREEGKARSPREGDQDQQPAGDEEARSHQEQWRQPALGDLHEVGS